MVKCTVQSVECVQCVKSVDCVKYSVSTCKQADKKTTTSQREGVMGVAAISKSHSTVLLLNMARLLTAQSLSARGSLTLLCRQSVRQHLQPKR